MINIDSNDELLDMKKDVDNQQITVGTTNEQKKIKNDNFSNDPLRTEQMPPVSEPDKKISLRLKIIPIMILFYIRLLKIRKYKRVQALCLI